MQFSEFRHCSDFTKHMLVMGQAPGILGWTAVEASKSFQVRVRLSEKKRNTATENRNLKKKKLMP